MTSSPPPSNTFADELDELMRPMSPGASDTDLPDLPTLPIEASQAENGTFNSIESSIGPMRNELAYARHLARNNKLNLYQRDLLDQVAKAPPLVRDILNFVQMCRLENKIDEIIVATPPYEVSPELGENIKSIVIAVLLSPKLLAYKGDIPKEGVLTILLDKRQHLPKNYDDDASVQSTIEAAIAEELVQTRSKLKKAIKEGIEKKHRLYDVAIKLVKDTKCSVTVPLCGKLALLRKLYREECGTKYWDKVDKNLEAIRKRANGDAVKISTVFKNLIRKDMDEFGSTESDKIPDELNNFQQGIEDSLDRLP